MLLIPTRVRPSLVHGFGLFALRRVRPGEVVSVWTDEDVACDPAVVDDLPPVERELALRHGFVDPATGLFLLAAGGERYINHSDAPNLAGHPARVRVAIREIEAGEELVEDYRVTEPGWRP